MVEVIRHKIIEKTYSQNQFLNLYVLSRHSLKNNHKFN